MRRPKTFLFFYSISLSTEFNPKQIHLLVQCTSIMEQKLKRGSGDAVRLRLAVLIKMSRSMTVDSTNIGLGLVNYWFNYWSSTFLKLNRAY